MTSMKWVGCLNHNLQHDTSEKPKESPTSDSNSTSLPELRADISVGGCILIPLAAIADTETLCTACVQWI